MSEITRFEIEKLHGYKDYDLHFSDNTLILVGENGSGKTTVLRLLHYFLSGQLNILAKYKFSSLKVTIDNKTYTLPYSYIGNKIKKLNIRHIDRFHPIIRNRINELLHEQNQVDYLLPEIEKLCDQFDIPIHHILREIDFENPDKKNRDEIKNILEGIRNSINSQIFYLPTYRRIEEELPLILKGVDDEEFRRRRIYLEKRRIDDSFVELVEFGMKDVDSAIEKVLEQLKDFARESLNKLTLGYLGDVVEQKYEKVRVDPIQQASTETIEKVLNRIHENILSKESKQHLSQTIQKVKNGEDLVEHAKVICHYFIKLLDFQQELQEKETQITNFCDVCNKYMVDKKFIYDSANFQFSVLVTCENEEDRNLELRHLSSGEKQIVSLFSHLYLSGGKSYFVLIDEPELSLSVPWQRKFLVDIKNSTFCYGLVAVTHSPFIYENDLKKYAHGLGEFIV